MKKIIILNILSFTFLLSPIAQVKYYESILDTSTIRKDSVTSIKKDLIFPWKIKNIGIIEPFVLNNLPAIKNIIISTINDEMKGKYDYTILKNDSFIRSYDMKDSEYIKSFFKKNKEYDAFLFIRHGFIQVDYKNFTVTVDQQYESQVLILLFNKQGALITGSYKNTNTFFNSSFNHNAMKRIEKASKDAISSMLDKIEKINTNLP